MSDVDDEVKETKATKFQRILDKLELIEKAVNKLNEEKPKQIKKPMDKDSDAYKNKRMFMSINLITRTLSFQRKRH